MERESRFLNFVKGRAERRMSTEFEVAGKEIDFEVHRFPQEVVTVHNVEGGKLNISSVYLPFKGMITLEFCLEDENGEFSSIYTLDEDEYPQGYVEYEIHLIEHRIGEFCKVDVEFNPVSSRFARESGILNGRYKEEIEKHFLLRKPDIIPFDVIGMYGHPDSYDEREKKVYEKMVELLK